VRKRFHEQYREYGREPGGHMPFNPKAVWAGLLEVDVMFVCQDCLEEATRMFG